MQIPCNAQNTPAAIHPRINDRGRLRWRRLRGEIKNRIVYQERFLPPRPLCLCGASSLLSDVYPPFGRLARPHNSKLFFEYDYMNLPKYMNAGGFGRLIPLIRLHDRMARGSHVGDPHAFPLILDLAPAPTFRGRLQKEE